MFAVLARRIRRAAASRGERETVRALLCDGEHERRVPSGSWGVNVPFLRLISTAFLQQASHYLWVSHGAVMEVVPLAGVLPDLGHHCHVRGVMSWRVAHGDFVVCPSDFGRSLHLCRFRACPNVVPRCTGRSAEIENERYDVRRGKARTTEKVEDVQNKKCEEDKVRKEKKREEVKQKEEGGCCGNGRQRNKTGFWQV